MAQGKDKASRLGRQLPVFVFPEELTYTTNDTKKILTIYNPYEFDVEYRVLCNCPERFTVKDSRGDISARCCVDIVIRCRVFPKKASERNSKFRVDLYKDGQVVGEKVVLSHFERTTEVPDQRSHSLRFSESSDSLSQSLPSIHGTQSKGIKERIHCSFAQTFVFLVCVCAVAVLFLPTVESKGGSSVPDYLLVSLQSKLVAAFVLGMVTMYVIRTD